MEKKNDSVVGGILKVILQDFIIPRSKEILNNTVTEGIYMGADASVNLLGKLIFGPDFGGQARRSLPNNPNKYSDISRRTTSSTPATPNIGTRSSKDLQYVVVPDLKMADAIKADLIDSIVKYGRVRVADLYEQSGQVKPSFSDYRFGWTNPADIHYTRDRNGYWFNLPTPKELSN